MRKNNSSKKLCLSCNKEINGRRDKKYCDQYCKSHFHYERRKNDKMSLHFNIHQQLRLNRKILKSFNRAGKTTVRKSELHNLGFNPRIITHYWKTKESKVYLFVFEYGYQPIIQNGKHKYLLIKWQKYMHKQIGNLA